MVLSVCCIDESASFTVLVFLQKTCTRGSLLCGYTLSPDNNACDIIRGVFLCFMAVLYCFIYVCVCDYSATGMLNQMG